MCLGSVGTIDRTWDEGGMPMASISGEPVCLVYTAGAGVGDVVLVHLGYAVEILDEERTSAAMELRSAIGSLQVREEER